MSQHFTVLVIGDNPEEQLAPYQENNMGDCPQEYLEFDDIEDENLKEYLNNTTKKVVMPDGRLLSTWDEEFRVNSSLGIGSDTHRVPEGLEVRSVPLTEIYSTFEEYMKDYVGYEKRDKKTGRYGSWDNPNEKWDWYQLGGRWSGHFKMKAGTDGVVGEPGLMTSYAEEGYSDQALLKDIDVEGMRKEAYEIAYNHYTEVENKFGGSIPKLEHTWPEILSMDNLSMNEKNELYSNQEAVKLKNKLITDIFFRLEDYQVSKEEYANNARLNALTTFAVVKDGKWYEKGDMCWWAIVDNKKENWLEEFNSLIDGLDENTLLSVYDCHI